MDKTRSEIISTQGRLTLAVVGLRSVLGLWFAYSGGTKLFVSGLDRFTHDIANYRMIGAPWDAMAAYSVPWLEIVAGICLLLGICSRGAILATAGLVAMFSFSIGWAWWHQLDISCGCHGGNQKIRYWARAAELAGYVLLLGWLWHTDRRGHGRMPGHEERAGVPEG